MGELRGRYDFSDVTGGTDASNPNGGNFGSAAVSPVQGDPDPQATGWGSAVQETTGAGTSSGTVGPPLVWLYLGILLAVVSGSLAVFLGGSPSIAIGSWVIGGPLAIALFAVFTRRDTDRRVNVLYSSGVWTTWIYRTGLVLVFGAITASAVQIALWVGRL